MDQQNRRGDDGLERREVKVDEPGLSPQTNARLTAEVREVVGDDQVTVPADRPHPSQGESSAKPGHRWTAEFKPSRFIMAMIGGSSVVIAAILADLTSDLSVFPWVDHLPETLRRPRRSRPRPAKFRFGSRAAGPESGGRELTVRSPLLAPAAARRLVKESIKEPIHLVLDGVELTKGLPTHHRHDKPAF